MTKRPKTSGTLEVSEEHQKTTTFEVQMPGGAKVKLSSRSMQIFLWLAVAGVLGYGGAVIWGQTIKLDMVILIQRETMRQIREIKCTLYLSEADRKTHPSLVSACKAGGEVQ